MDESTDPLPVDGPCDSSQAAGRKHDGPPAARTRWDADPDPPAESDAAGASAGNGDDPQDEYVPL